MTPLGYILAGSVAALFVGIVLIQYHARVKRQTVRDMMSFRPEVNSKQ